jgi:hypothetical protein
MSQRQKTSTICVHKFQVDGQNVGTCSLCGEVRQFPWDREGQVAVLKEGNPNHSKTHKPRRKTMHHKHHQIQERHRYYEANKEAIIADLLSLGRAATKKKWGIPPGGTITSLEERWLTEEQRSTIPSNPRGRPKQQPHHSTIATPSNGRLPPFPPFSDNWQPEVQLEWIAVYEKLATEKLAVIGGEGASYG